MGRTLKTDGMTIGKGSPLLIIAGPCVIEDFEMTYSIASFLKDMTERLEIPFIFKASYDKANRTSIDSYRGPGLSRGLEILKEIKSGLNIKILSDVHRIRDIETASEILDFIQIPAFLCRQTDFVVEAAKTGRPINIKKAQFLAPMDIRNVTEKIASTGNKKILVTERGTMFGYNNLVADFRSIKIIQDSGFPVIFDATHSVQLPGGRGQSSGGQREFAPILARSAAAAGADGVFLEVHPSPDKALCDGPNSLKLDILNDLFLQVKSIHEIAHGKKVAE